jgi:hypothetical protein
MRQGDKEWSLILILSDLWHFMEGQVRSWKGEFKLEEGSVGGRRPGCSTSNKGVFDPEQRCVRPRTKVCSTPNKGVFDPEQGCVRPRTRVCSTPNKGVFDPEQRSVRPRTRVCSTSKKGAQDGFRPVAMPKGARSGGWSGSDHARPVAGVWRFSSSWKNFSMRSRRSA